MDSQENKKRLESGLTDYEVGNHILHNICDNMTEFAYELQKTNPGQFEQLRKDLWKYRNILNKKYVRPLMGDGACS
jgi:hypothetical protein